MKYIALLLLCAVVSANPNKNVFDQNACPKDWKIEQLLPHQNCHKFYQCWNGQLVEQTCPSDLYFSIEANRCEWKDVVNCNGRAIVEEDNNGGENSARDDDSVAGNYDPSVALSICARSDSEGILVVHEKCDQYYICNNGQPNAQHCPKDLLFNPKNNYCDWPNGVQCGSRIIPNEENENIEDSNEGSGTGNDDSSLVSSSCAQDGSNGLLIAHNECDRFYICDNGSPVALHCPKNLLFNTETNICDWLNQVDCGNRILPKESNHNVSQDSSVAERDENNDAGDCEIINAEESERNERLEVTTSINDYLGIALSICAKEDSEGVLLAHEYCNQFYVCSYQKPVSLTCPAGLLYNPDVKQCDWPQQVLCGDRVLPTA